MRTTESSIAVVARFIVFRLGLAQKQLCNEQETYNTTYAFTISMGVTVQAIFSVDYT